MAALRKSSSGILSRVFSSLRVECEQFDQILADFVSTIGCDRATLMFVDTPAQVRQPGRSA